MTNLCFDELENYIDRNSSTPLYLQLERFILDKISKDILTEGEMLPTEMDFQRMAKLSRATVRQALSELDKDGYIQKRRGQGSKICSRKITTQVMKLSSFSEDMESSGLIPSTKTIDMGYIFPPQKVVDLSGFDPQEKVWFVKRVRYANGEPVEIHDLYIPPTLNIAPIEIKNMESYYRLLTDKLNLPPDRATETLTAINATAREAELLKIRLGAPILVVWRVTFSKSGNIIEVVRILRVAENYEYKTQLSRELPPL